MVFVSENPIQIDDENRGHPMYFRKAMSPLFEHANFAPGLTSHRIWLNSSHLANIQPRLLQLTVAPAGPRLLQRLRLKGTTKVIDGVTWRGCESGCPGLTSPQSSHLISTKIAAPSHVKTTKSPSFASEVPFLALQAFQLEQPQLWLKQMQNRNHS